MENSIETVGIFLAIILTFLFTFLSIPKIMRKMESAGLYGIDVNKIDKPKIPEMGGIAGVLGFILGATFVLGVLKYYSSIDETPVLVSISVISIASLIGLLDDVSILGRKEKAWFISLSALPLIISQIGAEKIDFFVYAIDFGDYRLFFWLILVPFGITACANALNMSAGYNGLESGQFAIISLTLLIISLLDGTDLSIIIIYASIFGASIGLYWYNKYPSKIFVGDIATLGFGALIAASVVMAGHIVFGILCILPAFYELFATIKYYFRGIERRGACMNPLLLDNGVIKPPTDSEDYTLAFRLLSSSEMGEKELVNRILLLYVCCGFISITVFFTFN